MGSPRLPWRLIWPGSRGRKAIADAEFKPFCGKRGALINADFVDLPHFSRAMSLVHDTAKAGFGSGTNELYDRYVPSSLYSSTHADRFRARPTYPPAALSFMRSKLPENGKFNIIEYESYC
jgi:hypothetical protein